MAFEYPTSFDALDLVSEQVIRPGTWPDANALGFRGVYLGESHKLTR